MQASRVEHGQSPLFVAPLFLLVYKHERDGPVARLLKFLVLFVAGVAVVHKLQPMFGFALF